MRIGYIDYNPLQAGHRLRIGVTYFLGDKVSCWMLQPQRHLLLKLVSMLGNDHLLGQTQRLLEVLRILRSRVVICSKPSTNRQLSLLEIANLCGRGVVVDICDNHFLNPYASDGIKGTSKN